MTIRCTHRQMLCLRRKTDLLIRIVSKVERSLLVTSEIGEVVAADRHDAHQALHRMMSQAQFLIGWLLHHPVISARLPLRLVTLGANFLNVGISCMAWARPRPILWPLCCVRHFTSNVSIPHAPSGGGQIKCQIQSFFVPCADSSSIRAILPHRRGEPW